MKRTALVIGAVIVIIGIIAVVIGMGTMDSGTTDDKTTAPSAAPTASDAAATTLPGGLVSTDQVVGTGEAAVASSSVTVKYTGTLQDGTVFDSTEKQGGQPVTFPLDRVIKGWQQGIPGMQVGGKRKLVIPPDLAYGSSNVGSIPPNSTLTFEIELLDVQ